MATRFAIEAPGRALGNAREIRNRHAAASMSGDRSARLPVGAGDPATGIGGPAAFETIVRPRYRKARYGVIEALATFAIVIWLTATVATLAGELWSNPSALTTQAAVHNPVSPPVSRVATSPAPA